MPTVNWLAVILAAVAAFGLGAVWYSPALFMRQWQQAAGLSGDVSKMGNIPLIFGLAFVFTLVIAANLAFFVGPLDLGATLAASLAAGLGFSALGLGIVALFERRPPAYILINGGYLTLMFLLMGLIIGLWR